MSLSVPGLWATWSIGMKATLGIAAATVLGSTTRPADIVEGLERLRCPRTVTVIAGFMVRYIDVVGDELRRLAVARVSRGDDPRWIGQVRATAMTVGTMFVRSYERGERVHQAMVARGFSGTVPPSTSRADRRADGSGPSHPPSSPRSARRSCAASPGQGRRHRHDGIEHPRRSMWWDSTSPTPMVGSGSQDWTCGWAGGNGSRSWVRTARERRR